MSDPVAVLVSVIVLPSASATTPASVVLTNGSPVETGDGTLAGGTLAVANSGNSVIATLTFPSLTGTAQFAWSLQRLVPPAA